MEGENREEKKHMLTMETNYKLKHREEEVLIPVSPMSQCLNSSFLSTFILAVFEVENPINESEMHEFLRTKFISITPRFTSIIENDKKGVARWKKVETQFEDHVIVPTFPLRLLSREEYDEQLKVYLSEIGCEKLSENRPLWELHVIKYPSLNGAGTLIFKFSHAIGDGYSFVKALLSAMKRADNPALPFTFPNLSLRKYEATRGNCLGFFSKCINTISDLTWNILKSSVLQDRLNVIRSGKTDVQLRPFSVYSLTLSLERVKQVKSKLGAVSSLSTTFAMFLSPRRGPKGLNTCHHKLMLGDQFHWDMFANDQIDQQIKIRKFSAFLY